MLPKYKSSTIIPAAVAVFGFFWILFSDSVVNYLVSDLATLTRIQTLKGWAFVAIMAWMTRVFLVKLEFADEERRKKEQRFLERYQNVVEGTADLVTVVNKDGNIEFINSRSRQIFGLEPSECIGKPAFAFVHTEDVSRTKDWFHKCISNQKRNCTFENRQISVDGRVVEMYWSVDFHYNSDGTLSHVNSIARDITSFRNAEKALQEALRQRSEFISTAAHELRTPLAAVMGCSEVLLKSDEFDLSEEKKQELLQMIFERSEVLSDCVDDLLDLGRAESGKTMNLQVEMCAPCDIIAGVVKSYMMSNESHEIFFEGPSADKCVALLDRVKIERLAGNLIDNALKFTPSGGEITIFCNADDQNFFFSVEDTGVGMTPEQQGKIFEKFYRADASDTAVSGMGLGLNIAFLIVSAHGGDISAVSEKGKGSKFSVIIPLRRAGA